MNNGHDVTLDTFLFLRVLHLLDAGAPLLVHDALATDAHSLLLSHARVDINVHGSDEPGAVGGPVNPTVALPAHVEEDEQRTGEVELEKIAGIEVGAADRIQGNVELGHQAYDVDEQAYIRAPNAESGAEGEFVQAMTLGSPGSG